MGKDLCIRCEKSSGEAVRKILVSLGMLDPGRGICAEGRSLFLPVLRSPTQSELELISKIAVVELDRRHLPILRKKKSSLDELLVGRVPESALRAVPRSYDFVGDIIVLEGISPEAAFYRREIAEALLTMHSHCRSVLLKTDRVSGQYRVPQLECLAGEDRRVTVHSEYGVKMKVDLSKAYFSPRLGYERHRVASSVRDGETVVDMFAGVGPFSLMIAKSSKSEVHAIDINPEAIRLLKENIAMNRLRGAIFPICGDARQASLKMQHLADRVIMNLPGQSLEFLNVATALLKEGGGLIHLYLFSREPPIENAVTALKRRSSHVPGNLEVICSRVVKATAPREWMVSLDLLFKP
ncbi:MAG: class I SAM-dependent methyltransferase family protein [Candidatus Verstraetearchaeota archaeon]|nr:class I SAM-dependent methyltransferase family protein [Candidatus Verstraetearchaeota archaeon]